MQKVDPWSRLPSWVPEPMKAFALGCASSLPMLALVGFCRYVSASGVPWQSWAVVFCGIGVAFLVLLSAALGFPAWAVGFLNIRGVRRALPFAGVYRLTLF